MAFPAVVNSANTTGSGTSHALTMPATIVAGRLLLAAIASSGADAIAISGFTQLGTASNGGPITLFGKIATGSDTATVTGTTGISRCGTTYQISGATSKLSAIGFATVIGSGPDPPVLNMGVSDDILWFAGVKSAAVSTGTPTNYTNLITTVNGSIFQAVAQRQLTASSENPSTYGGAAANTVPFTIGVPPPEVFGDIVFEDFGAPAYSATNPAVPYPAPTIAAGDLLVMVVGQKPSAAGGGTVTTPSGWALAGSLLDAGGYATTIGADVGNTNLFVYYTTAAGGETGTLSVVTSGSSVAFGCMSRLSSVVGTAWDVAVATGSDITTGATVSITMGSDPGIIAEDYIIGAMVIPTDVTTPAQFSAEALTATGATFGAVREIVEADSTLGNQIGGFLCRSRVTAGPSSAPPVMTATAGGTTTNVRGPGAFIRIRRTSPSGGPPPGQFLPFFGMGHHDEPHDEFSARRARRRPSGLYVPRRRELTVCRAA